MYPCLDPELIRPDMREQLDAYAMKGVPLCDFLIAIVSNDIVRALEKADADNINTIAAFGNYLYNKMPRVCWGSVQVYSAWVAYHQLKRDGADDDALDRASELVHQYKNEAVRRQP